MALGHRRLAILDLSDAARQPMVSEGGDAVITYNGEIYNFAELREELEVLGHRFRSSGDTEVLLAGYRQWGTEVLSRLSGIFAFAIWDAGSQRLFVARDPLGVKPLFYANDGETFRFGSEVKAILVDPAVSRELDEEALDAFFTFSYTPAPATGFRQIRQLLPGHAGVVTEHGFSSWSFWPCAYAAEPDAGAADRVAAPEGRRAPPDTHRDRGGLPPGAGGHSGDPGAAVARGRLPRLSGLSGPGCRTVTPCCAS